MNGLDSIRVARNLAVLLRSQWWPEEKIRAFQASALIGIMKHAVARVPFYKRLGISPDSIGSPGDLARFPILTKSMIQDHSDDLVCADLEKGELYSSRTSGTTSEPTTTYFDRNSWLIGKYAMKIRRVIAAFNPIGKRLLVVHAQTPEAIRQEHRKGPGLAGFLAPQRHISLFDPVERHVPVLSEFRPDIMDGPPSYFVELAEAFKAAGRPIPPVPYIFTGSEYMSRERRGSIEEAFRGKVIDVYGSTEFKEVAWQCHEGTYHVNFEHVFLEVPPSGNGTSSEASLLISTLTNRAMPLFRFAIGDLAKTEWKMCSCRRNTPVLTNIRGREADFVTLPSGKRVSPYLLTTVIEGYPGIRKYRIVQDRRGDLRIDYVSYNEPVGPSEIQRLSRQLTELAGERIELSFQRVGEITRSRGGKYRILANAAAKGLE